MAHCVKVNEDGPVLSVTTRYLWVSRCHRCTIVYKLAGVEGTVNDSWVCQNTTSVKTRSADVAERLCDALHY